MGWSYDGDVCQRCNERIRHDTRHDIYDDIKSFIHKIKVLENRLDCISENFPAFTPHNRGHDKFCPKEEANVLIEKVRLLERKINNFAKVLPLDNTANTEDGEQTVSYNAFETLIDKLKILEGKLSDFSKIKIAVNPTKTGDSENSTGQIKEKLRAMEEKIEHFYKLIPNSGVTVCMDKTNEDPAIIMEQMQGMADTSKICKTSEDPPIVNEQTREHTDTSGICKPREDPILIMEIMKNLADRIIKTQEDPPVIMEQMQELANTSRRIHRMRTYSPVVVEQMRELANKINFYSKIISSTATEPAFNNRKTLLPKPIFSGTLVPKRKSSVKKGFVTWPSEEDLSEINHDRRCYVMRCGDSQANNHQPNYFISEPSDFYFDLNLESRTNGISMRESKACGSSKVKNRELKR